MWLFCGLHRPDVARGDIVIPLAPIVAPTFAFWRRARWGGGLLDHTSPGRRSPRC
nr:hypothetical protein [Paraburkholderia ribeironis]